MLLRHKNILGKSLPDSAAQTQNILGKSARGCCSDTRTSWVSLYHRVLLRHENILGKSLPEGAAQTQEHPGLVSTRGCCSDTRTSWVSLYQRVLLRHENILGKSDGARCNIQHSGSGGCQMMNVDFFRATTEEQRGVDGNTWGGGQTSGNVSE